MIKSPCGCVSVGSSYLLVCEGTRRLVPSQHKQFAGFDMWACQQPLVLPCAQILGKAEFLNPGGSIKDRVALAIVREAAAQGRLRHGGLVTEGSAGALRSRLSV